LEAGKVRSLTKFGSDYQLVARSEKDVVMTNPKLTPFVQNFQTVVDKSNLSLPEWTNIAKRHPGLKGGVYSGNGYAEFVISGTK
jgi:hypothetical protein